MRLAGVVPDPNRPSLLSEVVYREIRRKIIFQEFKSGQVLNEVLIAQKLGFGRTPVRESLQRLAREGLVQVFARRGIFVSEMSLEQLRHVFEIRAPIEEQVSRRATLRADANDIEKMREALSDVDALIEQRRFRDLVDADERFHFALADAAKNPLMRDVVANLYGLGIRLWYATLPYRSLDDVRAEMALHKEILIAVEMKRPEKAAEAMLTLVEGFPNRVTEIFSESWPGVLPGGRDL